MNILIKSATIIDDNSEFHNKTQDVLIEHGIITKIDKHISNPNQYQEINLNNLHISQGWFDSSVCFGEPGYEERETLEHGLKVAALSGFTSICLNPNTNPVIDTNGSVVNILSKAHNNAVNVMPIGALTTGSNGEYLAELFDMHGAGAVGFYDYKKPINNPNLMKITLQYAIPFNGLICVFPQDQKIAGNGVVNEHIASTKLGLKGIPALAEELQIARDLYILEYTGGRLHIHTISTKDSVKLIRDAKQKGLNVTCSVALHNLILTDAVLVDFNTNYKVQPPLRTETDITALIEGIKDGTIDMITTDHCPIDIEQKKIEFDLASYGSIGLESAFGALQTVFNTSQTIKLLTQGKARFKVEDWPIKVGNKACITLFNPKTDYTFTSEHILSTSKNAIFENTTLKGKVYGIYNNNKLVLNI